MIFSENTKAQTKEFENLLGKSYFSMKQSSHANPIYYKNRNPIEFEKDVFNSLCEESKGTDFYKTIHLISGHKFPDIVINGVYGVEVKTTKQNSWKSTGNSVLESTRVESVDKIYIFFAKLTDPIDFMCRPYQDCLYDIAVTHSPRYLIDMELGRGQSIFDKMELSYDELRAQKNPIKPIVSYYRSIAKLGEEPWWMEAENSPELTIKPLVSIWNNVEPTKRNFLRNEAMARYPEIFGKSNSTKYNNFALWLAARYGIINHSLRDVFSAGGSVSVIYKNKEYNLPHIFGHLEKNIKSIIEIVDSLSPEEASYCWKLNINNKNKINIWVEEVAKNLKQVTNFPDINNILYEIISHI